MDGSNLLPESAPRLFPRRHSRTPSHSPTRQRFTDDILSDISPATTLEAFTSPSGKLKASIEAATVTERAFGIRATLASKKIQEWVDELSTWPWPTGNNSAGFELPTAKRRRISVSGTDVHNSGDGYPIHDGRELSPSEYTGSLLTQDLIQYETRLDEIHEDMEDLNVEDIKSQVLNTHFSARSRPSSSASNVPLPSLLASYTRMEDFTAIVTAIVLQALPNLSKLMRLMDVWSIRLVVLRKVPPILLGLDEAEVALRSGWQAINIPLQNHGRENGPGIDRDYEALSPETFNTMKDVLEDKVTTLGRELDFMLDALEGREDTLPEAWLDRMEAIEHDYGEWVVSGDRKVREGEWARMSRLRKEREDALRAKEEEATRKLKEEEDARKLKEEEDIRRLKEEEDVRRLRQEEAAQKLREEEDMRKLKEQEAARKLKEEEDMRKMREEEDARKLRQEEAVQKWREEEDIRQMREKEAVRKLRQEEVARKMRDEEDMRRLKEEEDVRKLRQEEAARKMREEEDMRQMREEEDARKLRQEEAAQKLREEVDMRKLKEQEAARQLKEEEKERKSKEREDALRLKQEQDMQRVKDEEGMRKLKEQEDTLRLKEDDDLRKLKEEDDALRLKDEEAAEAARATREQSVRDADAATSAREREPQANPESKERTADEFNPSSSTTADLEIATAGGLVTSLLAKPESQYIANSIEANDTDAHPTPILRLASLDGSNDTEPEPLTSAIVSKTPIPNDHQSQPGTEKVMANAIQPLETAKIASTARDKKRTLTPQTPVYNERTSELHVRDRDTSETPHQPPHFGHAMVDTIVPSSHTRTFKSDQQTSSQSSPSSVQVPSSPKEHLQPLGEVSSPITTPSTPSRSAVIGHEIGELPPGQLGASRGISEEEWIIVNSRLDDPHVHVPSTESWGSEARTNDAEHISTSNGHQRNVSVISGYSTSASTPEIREAEPAEYFRPLAPLVINRQVRLGLSEPTTPSTPMPVSSLTTAGEMLNVSPEITLRSLAAPVVNVATESLQDSESPTELSAEGQNASEAMVVASNTYAHGNLKPPFKLEDIDPTVLSTRRTAAARANEDVKPIENPSRANVSITSRIVNGREDDVVASPIGESTSPKSDASDWKSFPTIDEQSPSIGRIGSLKELSGDVASSPPPPIPEMSARRTLQLRKGSNESTSESPDVPSTPVEPPLLDNVDVLPASPKTSPKKTSEDQIQQQISSILESIPAHILLTSEAETDTGDHLYLKKPRRSITPSIRSPSSLSNYSRASTPSFTLAPAYGKGSSRSRPSSGNPEIKLYHLSRSTGEAPIKLFVRLVGEHGERVMVRVGGGWADLGEYLKEYASHHGRRSAVYNDKVEIQDIPRRVVSNTSTVSSSVTARGSGRSSPVGPPGSVPDRPASSLNIRKTRKSVGDDARVLRGPSTPLNTGARRPNAMETPPSASSAQTQSSSRLSWAEDESSLGLAGPKSKNVVISEKDQEWVESMKEKVRQASAEKERRQTSFGEMDKVGWTKRLFRKA